jgi:N-acetylglucosaminyl-diphospho-decaprenol L-rhamnosyltransferase
VNGIDSRQHHSAELAIIVVNFGVHEMIRDSLAGIDLASIPAQVFVVDNYHSPQERAGITLVCEMADWALIPLTTNTGFGAGMNQGVSAAREGGYRSFLLLNPDARISSETASALLTETQRNRNSLISPVILRPDGSTWFAGATIDMSTGDLTSKPSAGVVQPAPWLTAACLAVHDDMWRNLGGFDEDYFLYWEDVDLSFRCSQLGGELVVRDDLNVVHEVGGTQGSEGKSNIYYYYNCRNRLMFASKHLSQQRMRDWLLRTPASSWAILLRGGRRQLLQSLQPLVATARGSWHGTRLVLKQLTRPDAELAGSDTPNRQVS